jgi:hypothetical protein
VNITCVPFAKKIVEKAVKGAFLHADSPRKMLGSTRFTIFGCRVYRLPKSKTISYVPLTLHSTFPMKRVFTFLLLLVCLPGFAQEELPSYTEAVQVSGATRQELFGRAQDWLKHLDYQISFDNPESGFISVGGEMPLREPGTGKLIYVLTLIVEEQKYWYEFTQYYDEPEPVPGKGKKAGKKAAAHPAGPNLQVYDALDAQVRSEIDALKQAMLAESAVPAGGGVMGNTEN